jgi:hypothetical protein
MNLTNKSAMSTDPRFFLINSVSYWQNKLERFCIAYAMYTAWFIILPAAIAFGVERVLFFSRLP